MTISIVITDLTHLSKIGYNIFMKTDYLISNNGLATGLSAMMDNSISHDQITRFLSKSDVTSKDLWMKVKKIVRDIESEEGCLIFDVPQGHFLLSVRAYCSGEKMDRRE